MENVQRKTAHFRLSSVAQERRIRKLPHSLKERDLIELDFFHFWSFIFKPGFHIVVSVVSVVRKKFIGQIQLYGNLPYKSSIQKKRQIQLVLRDRMNSICPMNFFRTTYTTDTTIWKPSFNIRFHQTASWEEVVEMF